jgi:hypothetical protein
VSSSALPLKDAPPESAQPGRQGFVLVTALLAIVLIAALAAGVLFATTETAKVGTVGIIRERALIASESALAAAITGTGTQFPASIGAGGTISYRADGDGCEVVVYITRLDSATYWIVADATQLSSGIGGGKRVGAFVRTSNHDDHSISIDPIPDLAWAELF